MANHIHLILTPDDQPALSSLGKYVCQRYAQGRNELRGGSGRLFEERFFSKPILDRAQLALTTAYIELNPVRAGLVATPDQWPWSTYALHAGLPSKIPAGLWTPSLWYSALASDVEGRASRYRDWVEACRLRGERPDAMSAAEQIRLHGRADDRVRVERPDRTSAL